MMFQRREVSNEIVIEGHTGFPQAAIVIEGSTAVSLCWSCVPRNRDKHGWVFNLRGRTL